VSYTAREKASKGAYDTTDAETAKAEGIFNPERQYRPLPVIIGKGHVFERLENELREMKAGETRKIELAPKDAFGERNQELIRIIALKSFHDKKINPFPGLIVEVDGMHGKIQSVSGGRVKVDFNHELAGKELEYEIKVERRIESEKEIAETLAEKYFSFLPKEQLKVEESGSEKITVKMPKALVEAKEFKAIGEEFREMIAGSVKAKIGFEGFEEKKGAEKEGEEKSTESEAEREKVG